MIMKEIPTLDSYISETTNKFYAFDNVTECISSEDTIICNSVLNMSDKLK